MVMHKTIDLFFKRKVNEKEENDIVSAFSPPTDHYEIPRIEHDKTPYKILKVTYFLNLMLDL